MAADRSATPATLAAVFAASQTGDVIHLESGDYGRFQGGAKAGMVTLVPAAGATATVQPDLDHASNIRFQGLTLGRTWMSDSRNIEFLGNRFVGMAQVDATRQTPNAGILFDSNSFLGIDLCSTCFEGRLTVNGQDNTEPVGVTIANNHFGDGGESDGVQVVGGANGVRILNNEFGHIQQGPYVAHVDPIQLYGSSHTLISGNWFHDNDTGIMGGDGTNHETITDNLFGARANGYPWPVVLGADVGSTVAHNTFVDGACEFNLRCGILRIDGGNQNVASRGTVVRDNVVTELAIASGSQLAEEDHNLVVRARGNGAHDLSGRPSYAGGSDSWNAFRLAPGSLGTGAASDGQDIGIFDRAATGTPSTPAIPPPTVGSGRGAAGPPTLALVRPRPGVKLKSRMMFSARAADDSGIARVEFWVGRIRLASAAAAPFKRAHRVPRRVPRGIRTVTARAIAVDGDVASVGVTVIRGQAPAATHHWRVAARTVAGRTVLTGRGPARGRVAVTLARCGDARARPRAPVRLRAGTRGRLRSSRPTGGLCVLGLRPLQR